MNVEDPTTIHGSRQTGTTTLATGAPAGALHRRTARASQSGTPQSRACARSRVIEASACGTSSMTVTQTGMPASRRRRTSRSRFSSLLAMTSCGARSTITPTFGFFVPRTRGTSRSAGCVHQSVAPARASRRVTATASVSEGTRETTRVRGPAGSEHGIPRSSARLLTACVPTARRTRCPPGPRGRSTGPSRPGPRRPGSRPGRAGGRSRRPGPARCAARGRCGAGS